MIFRAVLVLLFCLTGPGPADAGAWLQARGDAFVSSSGTVSENREMAGALYAEYGLTDRLTLGLDVFGGMDQQGLPSGEGVVFLRFPIGPTDRAHKWAGQLGLGGRHDGIGFVGAVEVGASWGYGFAWRGRSGWAAIDATINVAKTPEPEIVKLDSTVGLALGKTIRGMAQIFLTMTDGEIYTTLAPSILIAPGDGRVTYQIGAEFPVSGSDDPPRIKLGLWRSF